MEEQNEFTKREIRSKLMPQWRIGVQFITIGRILLYCHNAE